MSTKRFYVCTKIVKAYYLTLQLQKKKKKKKKLKLNLLKLKVSTKDIEGHTFHDGLKVISSSKNQPYKTIFLTWLILILHFESEF